ncbi:uncharacterized protein BT62DRAFT_210025 [Guyanagaster necrorhizus]|uniref:Uncharacterized protein n=1 Tax=Guyanagaster necrorhizus TaxID=856835 RepID=A0A9P8ARH8_9AGAR|nr:uncharacterized protein BT62DRAFT_210025 [Guyanagaster necrorhizus MCA 3950]KAG7445100.1 hypothetical protein BT62DRAFT_210025 [Guyanagaster necrorhizus MCA 3950]
MTTKRRQQAPHEVLDTAFGSQGGRNNFSSTDHYGRQRKFYSLRRVRWISRPRASNFSSTTGAALLEGGVEGYQRSPFGTPESRCGSRLLILNDSEDGFGWS